MSCEHDDPRPPRAVCANDHLHWLEFTRCPWRGEWQCACPKCEDAEYNYSGVCRRTDPVGCGQTPDQALADYCAKLDIEPAELLVGECHV